MPPSYLISEDEWCAMGFDEVNDPPNYYDDDLDQDPEDFDQHPSLTVEERNPSLRSQWL